MKIINVTKVDTRKKSVRVEVEPPAWQQFIYT
jgi:hypothetical protein